jgi:hypothetical protein
MYFAEYLSTQINTALTSRVFPDSLKLARVLIIFKTGSKQNPENYRSISILSSLSKNFETVISRRLEIFLTENKILLKKTACFFLDISEAFNSPNHKTLIIILAKVNIRSTALKLPSNFICNRKKIIRINDSISNKLLMPCGIPQGSVLGPFFFSF